MLDPPTVQSAHRRTPRTRVRRVQMRAEETRDRLVSVAVKLFAARGFDGVTLRDIAAAAERPLSAIAYHFISKDELWRSAATKIHQTIEDHFSRRIAGLEGVDAETSARLIVKDYVYYFSRNPEMLRFMVHLGFAPSARLDWYVEQYGKPFRSHFEAAFREIGRQHGIGDTEPRYAALLYTFIGGAGLIYALAAEVKRTTGIDPATVQMLDDHVALLTAMFLPLSAKALEKRPGA